VISRGDLFWVEFGPAVGSRPAKRRPALVVQADEYNNSNLATTVVAAVTSNLALADRPGNVLLTAASTGLSRDSVVNVTQIYTMNKFELLELAGRVPADVMQRVAEGLRRVIGVLL
jgi:mRNA interferase MazF